MNEEQHSHNSIQEKVLEKIHEGKVRMRSRPYFIMWMVFTIFIGLITLALSVFAISFVMFSIHESGELFLLGFGARGIITFLALFPWILLGIDLAMIFFLEWLLQKFKFGYRIPLLYIFLILLAGGIILGLLLNITSLHSTLLRQADEGKLPIVGDIYESIRDSHQDQGVFRGTITSLAQGGFTITHDDHDHDKDEGTFSVIAPINIVQSQQFQIGDRAYILGTNINGVIQATNIEKLAPDQ